MSARLYRLPSRGVATVRGDDRQRWLDGMLTCNVKQLRPGDGARGLLLTPQGRIVCELHVLHRGEALWLETEASALGAMLARLEKYVIADDVALADATPAWARLALEGEGALAAFSACGGGAPERAHGVADVSLAGVASVAARYGFTHAEALQLFVPRASEAAVVAALREAGAELASDEELECGRIEAGTPWLGKELDESVLPAEAGLDGVAVAPDKGCYTGQEVVARMRSRGRLAHRLVGLRFASSAPPAPRTVLVAEKGDVGSVTSVARSPRFGAIGLGFVQTALAEPGTTLQAGETEATVSLLPFASNDTLGPHANVSLAPRGS